MSTDASSFELGAVLLQFKERAWIPVAYASHSMMETERRYAQIEKEALRVTWACEKFSHYLLGQEFEIKTVVFTVKLQVTGQLTPTSAEVLITFN